MKSVIEKDEEEAGQDWTRGERRGYRLTKSHRGWRWSRRVKGMRDAQEGGLKAREDCLRQSGLFKAEQGGPEWLTENDQKGEMR